MEVGMDRTKNSQRYYLKNREAIKLRVSVYQTLNKKKCNLRKKLWARRNRKRVMAARKRWSNKNPDFKRLWAFNKRRNDVGFRILCNLRRRLYDAQLRQKQSKSATKLLGCSLEDFRIYLESKFEPGMTWENYGRYGWHIDHIVPCALFDMTDANHRRRCFHFSNLQPMFASKNHKKSAKSDGQLRIL
jgi:Prasinovirus endonuclease VII